jgi:dihydroorotate dehydrogenase
MYRCIRPILFLFKPERAHHIAISLLRLLFSLPGGAHILRFLYGRRISKPLELFGIKFRNPVGLAAGFDKNGQFIEPLSTLGFGFLEIGSVTARPALGNPHPRLFRLPADRAVINRMGLNNEGCEAVADRLRGQEYQVPIFINIAKTHDAHLQGQAAVDDYCVSIRTMKSLADVLVINISCPNSGDGRTFEDPDSLQALLPAIQNIVGADGPPYLVKVSPDLSNTQLEDVVRLSLRYGASGFIATNTTVSRDGLQASKSQLDTIGAGGMSGGPLHPKALNTVRNLRTLTDKPIVGVGGILGVKEAQAFLDAGANLVQVYSGFIYGGPGLIGQIVREIQPTKLSIAS